MPKPLSYYHQPYEAPLEHRTLFQLLDHHASKFPNKEAIIYRDENNNRKSLTFQEYRDQSRVLAAKLTELGLRRGHLVLALLPSEMEFAIVQMALGRIGAVFMALEKDDDLTVTNLRDQIHCVFYSVDSDEMRDAIPKAVELDQFKAAVYIGSHITPPNMSKIYDYHALFLQEQTSDYLVLDQAGAEVKMEDPFVVLFTSGSTGRPKPIMYTNHGFVNGAIVTQHLYHTSQDAIIFSDSPLDWITGFGFGLAMVPLLGATLVMFPPNLSVKGHVTLTILEIIEEEKCTHGILLSYLLIDMTLCPEISRFDVSNLKSILTGGQLMDKALMKKVLDTSLMKKVLDMSLLTLAMVLLRRTTLRGRR
ncbi:putative acyl-CoA synthetase YngI [Nematostella vectensis]|uniref:putative acyl-CoA synthetase YngI n=1 Tax=Nematostella vectensis TaxID=45351 RepID=UPI001390335F|nr:putative acyl-CoA synthetase YngI [Nematostella vectensis]